MLQQNNDFCAICGSVLPSVEFIPSMVQCALCKTKWPAYVDIGKVISRYERSYEKAEAGAEELRGEDVTVEHQCPKCDHNVATYTTQQTRSADEGQTIFYQCMKCKHRTIEYS